MGQKHIIGTKFNTSMALLLIALCCCSHTIQKDLSFNIGDTVLVSALEREIQMLGVPERTFNLLTVDKVSYVYVTYVYGIGHFTINRQDGFYPQYLHGFSKRDSAMIANVRRTNNHFQELEMSVTDVLNLVDSVMSYLEADGNALDDLSLIRVMPIFPGPKLFSVDALTPIAESHMTHERILQLAEQSALMNGLQTILRKHGHEMVGSISEGDCFHGEGTDLSQAMLPDLLIHVKHDEAKTDSIRNAIRHRATMQS